jgi:hypothetical protein
VLDCDLARLRRVGKILKSHRWRKRLSYGSGPAKKWFMPPID